MGLVVRVATFGSRPKWRNSCKMWESVLATTVLISWLARVISDQKVWSEFGFEPGSVPLWYGLLVALNFVFGQALVPFFSVIIANRGVLYRIVRIYYQLVRALFIIIVNYRWVILQYVDDCVDRAQTVYSLYLVYKYGVFQYYPHLPPLGNVKITTHFYFVVIFPFFQLFQRYPIVLLVNVAVCYAILAW